jgi:hypothetical protein
MDATGCDETALSDERAFIENLLNVRANFGLVVFGLAAAAAAATDNRWVQCVVLVVGGMLVAALASATARSQWKLDLILDKLPSTHPAKFIDGLANDGAPKLNWLQRKIYGSSRRRLVGYIIPIASAVLLLVGAIVVSFGVFSKQNDDFRALTARVDSLVRLVASEKQSAEQQRVEFMKKWSMADESLAALRKQIESYPRAQPASKPTPKSAR